MKKFLLKITKYGLITLLLGNIIGWTGDFILRRSSIFKPSFLVNNFESNNKVDYFILGSSRGLTTLNTKKIDSALNTKGINLSMDDTDLKTHLLMLNHFFKSGYKSDYCILTLDRGNFNKTETKLGDNDYKFSPFIGRKYVKEHFRINENHRLKPIYISSYLPIIKYSYYNLQLIPSTMLSAVFPSKRHRFDSKGNYSYPFSKKKKQHAIDIETQKQEITNPLVDSVRSICKKNKTKLLIYVAPYEKIKINLPESNEVINHSGIISDNRLFYDIIHVNSEGRKIATQSFIEALKSKLQ